MVDEEDETRKKKSNESKKPTGKDSGTRFGMRLVKVEVFARAADAGGHQDTDDNVI